MTVLKQFRELLPNENCIYFGDTANMPYGEKSQEQLITFSRRIFDFFEKQKVKAVVMACNTTSSLAYDALKEDYSFKIYPIIQSTANILATLPVRKLGVFATQATISSHAYRNYINNINPSIVIKEIACPDWVKIVEENSCENPQSIEKVKSKLDSMMSFQPDKIVLGCTHYPYLLKQLSLFAPEDLFINPAEQFAHFIKQDLIKNNLLSDSNLTGTDKFCVSAAPEQFKCSSALFYDVKSLPELIKL